MKNIELYEYCLNNANASDFLINDIEEPLTEVISMMKRSGKDINAFELDVARLTVNLWSVLAGRCFVTVNINDVRDILLNHYLPELERRLKRTMRGNEDIGICTNATSAILFYGDEDIVGNARDDFYRHGPYVFGL